MADACRFRVAGLFAGIGGFELGLRRAGHETGLLCESDEAARAVLKTKFKGIDIADDVKDIDQLSGYDVVTAGFPCQDLSQVGQTNGINGSKSGIVSRLFRILGNSDIPWVLIENVPFMLYLHGGSAIRYLVQNLESLGYDWAYRIIDTRAFGLPQRRQRVFLLASKVTNPSSILLGADAKAILDPRPRDMDLDSYPIGFYWTEGNRGGGWAKNAVPALKPGSGRGIPSPPAIVFQDGFVGVPVIEEAEKLQGLPAGWTKPAANVTRNRYRWKLVGNSISVPITEWIGKRLADSPPDEIVAGLEFDPENTWPKAAWGGPGRKPKAADVSMFPVRRKYRPLRAIVASAHTPLSSGATTGFADRLERSRLVPPPGFVDALRRHATGNHSWHD